MFLFEGVGTEIEEKSGVPVLRPTEKISLPRRIRKRRTLVTLIPCPFRPVSDKVTIYDPPSALS
jgi:hypothetical protein